MIMRTIVSSILALSFFCFQSRTLALTAHNSWHSLPMANGLCAMHFDAEKLEISSFYPHIYAAPAPDLKTESLIKTAGFVLDLPNGKLLLRKLARQQLGFIPGTGIVRLTQAAHGLQTTSYYFAPMTITARSLVAVIEISNAAQFNVTAEKVFLQLNTDQVFDKIRLTGAKGASIWVAEIYIFSPDAQPNLMAELNKRFRDGHPEKVLDAEQRWWENWHLDSEIPRTILGDEYLITRQNAAFIKMAQCQEHGPAKGQILSSLPPAENRYCWPADAAFAIAALSQIKHLAEARDALKFFLNAETGLHPELFVSSEKTAANVPKYLISPASYYGNGREMAVHSGPGSILRLDGFGLILWALEVYLKNGGDTRLLNEYWPIIYSGIIDLLIANIDATGLIRADSGPYNAPLPGEHHAHTSAATVLGLRSAGFLAYVRNDEKMMVYFMDIAEQIRQTMLKRLIDERKNILRASLEKIKYPDYLDVAIIECLNWGIVEPGWVITRETLKELDKRLLLRREPVGYRSYPGKAWTGRQESPFANLRIAAAYYKMKKKPHADALMKWIFQQALENYDLIPQFYQADSGDYAGSVPAIGRGAGAWILTILAR